MGKIINAATTELIRIANNNDYGYSQEADERMTISRDCSSNVILAWEKAGIPVFSKYGATYTGNIQPTFQAAGFINVTHSINLETGEGLIIGDVLLRIGHHVAGYIGKNAAGVREIVQAESNEKGTTTGGKPGDQTRREIYIKEYYNSPPHWDIVLRYPEVEETPTWNVDKNLHYGDKNSDVYEVALALEQQGYGASLAATEKTNKIARYGDNMKIAIENFQKKYPETGTNGKPDYIVGRKVVEKLGGKWNGK